MSMKFEASTWIFRLAQFQLNFALCKDVNYREQSINYAFPVLRCSIQNSVGTQGDFDLLYMYISRSRAHINLSLYSIYFLCKESIPPAYVAFAGWYSTSNRVVLPACYRLHKFGRNRFLECTSTHSPCQILRMIMTSEKQKDQRIVENRILSHLQSPQCYTYLQQVLYTCDEQTVSIKFSKYCRGYSLTSPVLADNARQRARRKPRRQPWPDRAAQGRPARPMGPLVTVLVYSEQKIKKTRLKDCETDGRK